MKPFLERELEGAVLTLRMNEPDRRNVLTGNTAIEEFCDACESIIRDPRIRVLIITGNGPSFCAGGNLKDMRRYLSEDISVQKICDEYRQGIQRLPRILSTVDVPIIAAINGPAIGAGLDLACMCDIRISAESAIFASSFIKVGIVPGDGGAWLLPRLIGSERAARMIFTGESISATTALDYGLVSQVVADSDLLPTVSDLAYRIARNPGHTLRLSKRLLKLSDTSSLNEILELSAAYQAISHKTRDHAEALDAFQYRREPIFNQHHTEAICGEESNNENGKSG